MITRFRGFISGLPLPVAVATIGVWGIGLWCCLQIQVGTLSPIAILCLIGWQTWIYTGLFITAHDAIHGSIHPLPQVNRAIGQLCLWLYAGFDYSLLASKHDLHHQYPASDRDPDFHDGKTANFWGWYAHFVCEHVSWGQAINLLLMLGIYTIICQSNLATPILDRIPNLLLFWMLPSLFSSLQLFYFGTFLPHREPPAGYLNPHRAQTIARSRWWSLISCYHFGYHQEHHESPQLPWWQLYR
jgi:beta-carotene/zeaxanthin 4-ketolase